MKKFCIFDLDGTLVDSMEEWERMMLRILDDEGITYPEGFINTITPLGANEVANLYLKMGVKCTREELLTRMGGYAIEAYKTRIPLKKGVAVYLRDLKEKGHVLAVLTASPHVTTDPCLVRNGIYDLFEKVFSVEDFKELTKSQPEIYEKAAECLGAQKNEITFFDDNLLALSAAKRAGLECVGVYDISSRADTEKIKELCDMYVESFEK